MVVDSREARPCRPRSRTDSWHGHRQPLDSFGLPARTVKDEIEATTRQSLERFHEALHVQQLNRGLPTGSALWPQKVGGVDEHGTAGEFRKIVDVLPPKIVNGRDVIAVAIKCLKLVQQFPPSRQCQLCDEDVEIEVRDRGL